MHETVNSGDFIIYYTENLLNAYALGKVIKRADIGNDWTIANAQLNNNEITFYENCTIKIIKAIRVGDTSIDNEILLNLYKTINVLQQELNREIGFMMDRYNKKVDLLEHSKIKLLNTGDKIVIKSDCIFNSRFVKCGDVAVVVNVTEANDPLETSYELYCKSWGQNQFARERYRGLDWDIL